MRISDWSSDVCSSDLFANRDLEPAPLSETLRSEWRVIVAGAFAPLASFALFHMVTVFPLSWVFLFTDETPVRFLMIEAIAAVFGFGAIIASGTIADRIGRRTPLGVTAAAVAVSSEEHRVGTGWERPFRIR